MDIVYYDNEENEIKLGTMVELLPETRYSQYHMSEDSRVDGIRFVYAGGRWGQASDKGKLDNVKGGMFVGTRRIGIPSWSRRRNDHPDRTTRRTVPVFMFPQGLVTFVDNRGRPIPADTRLPLLVKT